MSDVGSQSEHRSRLCDLQKWFELSIEILESLSYSIQSEESLLFSGVIDHSLLLRIDDLTGRFESESFSQILKDLKAVNEQHISPSQHAIQVAGKAYPLAAEAVQALLKTVHSKLVLISDRFDSGAVRYHISGLSSIGLNEPFLEELRELFFQQVSCYRCHEDLERQEKIGSIFKKIDLIKERLEAGAERGQVLKWTDAGEAAKITKATDGLPESVKRREKEFSSPQNITQDTSNAQNAKKPHLISEDHSDLEKIGGSTIQDSSPLVLPEIDDAQSLAELDQKADLKPSKKKQQAWWHSPLERVPDSHRDKNNNPIGGFRGTQKRLAYTVSEDPKTFKRRAQRGSVFVFQHKKGDYEMFIHQTEIGKLEEFRKRFEEFPAKNIQSISKEKRTKGNKRD